MVDKDVHAVLEEAERLARDLRVASEGALTLSVYAGRDTRRLEPLSWGSAHETAERLPEAAGRSPAYSEVCSAQIPPAQRERRDRLLTFMRANPEMRNARELVDVAPGYTLRDYQLLLKDLGHLERHGLARSIGHPKQWVAAQGGASDGR